MSEETPPGDPQQRGADGVVIERVGECGGFGHDPSFAHRSWRRESMKVIFRYDAGPGLTAQFAALAGEGFLVTPCPEHDDLRFARLLADAEVLLHILKPLTKAVIDLAPALRLIQKIGVGVNTIDLVAARVARATELGLSSLYEWRLSHAGMFAILGEDGHVWDH